MNLSALSAYLAENQQPNFRGKQIIKNYYSGRFHTFSQMTDLPLDLRSALDSRYPLLSVVSEKIQKTGQTQKALLKLADASLIESVLMDYDGWLTACLSSQVGCPLGCAFCATGQMGFKRNLMPEEIVDQLLFWNNLLYPTYVGRIVFMGMGEPFLNWENVKEAITIFNDRKYLNIGMRKMSLSTAGIIPQIQEFTNFNKEINLAISLHAATQSTREKIMPIAKQYPLDELQQACLTYVKETHRQLFFEYALIKGINDNSTELKQLISFINSSRLFFLNLIPLNSTSKTLTTSDQVTQDFWCKSLTSAHCNFSVRRSFGQEINAACGQLATQN